MEKYAFCSDAYHSEPLSMSAGIATSWHRFSSNEAPYSALRTHTGAVSRVVVSTTVSLIGDRGFESLLSTGESCAGGEREVLMASRPSPLPGGFWAVAVSPLSLSEIGLVGFRSKPLAKGVSN